MNHSQSIQKLEHYALGVFLTCMMVTASLFLIAIWTQTPTETYMKTVATFFVIGFAHFLLWLPMILYRLLNTPHVK